MKDNCYIVNDINATLMHWSRIRNLCMQIETIVMGTVTPTAQRDMT